MTKRKSPVVEDVLVEEALDGLILGGSEDPKTLDLLKLYDELYDELYNNEHATLRKATGASIIDRKMQKAFNSLNLLNLYDFDNQNEAMTLGKVIETEEKEEE